MEAQSAIKRMSARGMTDLGAGLKKAVQAAEK